MAEETDAQRRWRIGLRTAGVDQVLLNEYDEYQEGGRWAHVVEEEGTHGLLGNVQDSGDLTADAVHTLLEKAYDQGWKQALHERETGRA